MQTTPKTIAKALRPSGEPTHDGPRAVVVSLSSIRDDPRVRRQILTLSAAGWSVTSVGFGSTGIAVQNGQHVEVPRLDYDRRLHSRALRILGLLGCRAWSALAQSTWARQPRHKALVDALGAILAADLVVANDYTSVPACVALAQQLGAKMIYDMHEYSAGEREEDLRWRVLYPRYIRSIERSAIKAGAVLTTVSNGIAVRVAADYELQQPPLVVRNVPSYVPIAFRPTGEVQLVHYHGALVDGRGIELLIRSVPLWEKRFRLRIRGPGETAYVRSLRDLIDQLGLNRRVVLEGPVASDRLIAMSADADIGIHMLPGFSYQNTYALPNKLFEYMMAGLAIVFSDLPEIAEIIRRYGAGAIVRDQTPESVAAAVNSLTRDRIDGYRAASLEAAAELCWEREQAIFLKACDVTCRHAGTLAS